MDKHSPWIDFDRKEFSKLTDDLSLGGSGIGLLPSIMGGEKGEEIPPSMFDPD